MKAGMAAQGFGFQMLAAKLGVVTGRHLAQHCRCAIPGCTGVRCGNEFLYLSLFYYFCSVREGSCQTMLFQLFGTQAVEGFVKSKRSKGLVNFVL